MKMFNKNPISFPIIEKTATNMYTTMKIINFKKNIISEYIGIK
jgi:hypothetical protein